MRNRTPNMGIAKWLTQILSKDHNEPSGDRGLSRFDLQLKAVHLECLGKNGERISVASGFICRESDGLYLYTCWHVVTGYDPSDLKVMWPPRQVALMMHFQGFEQLPNAGLTRGHQSHRIELYDVSTSPPKPRWLQNRLHIPHGDLNNINIRVPAWHDLIKLELPEKLNISPLQIVEESAITHWPPQDGDKMYVVGFPYGYSALTMTQPTAIVLTRYIAASVAASPTVALLDGIGAQGMSGCPVFVELDGRIFLSAVYTGSVYPDHIVQANNPVTALGKITILRFALRSEYAPLIDHDDPRVEALKVNGDDPGESSK